LCYEVVERNSVGLKQVKLRTSVRPSKYKQLISPAWPLNVLIQQLSSSFTISLDSSLEPSSSSSGIDPLGVPGVPPASGDVGEADPATRAWLIFARFHTLIPWSLYPVTSTSCWSCMHSTLSLWSGNLPKHLNVARSQTRVVLSLDAVTSVP
jgi:hypothetical protein